LVLGLGPRGRQTIQSYDEGVGGTCQQL
jgi:hypothetical protein